MKIGIAQIKPSKGNIQENIQIHKKWIEASISEKVDIIVFPELSLTGYEPELAQELALEINDVRLDEFQKLSDQNNITIGLGIPFKKALGISIGMVIFQPKQSRIIYSKQRLHPDELPYFIEGEEQVVVNVKNHKIAPAICFESLQEDHAENAQKLGAEIYLASVAKSENGIKKAYEHYPKIARKFSMPILMANCFGFCDNYFSAGQSAVWNKEGKILEKLKKDSEGLLVFDTEIGEVINNKLKCLNNRG
ncbi:carbon-nitrogen hydrolase family protein [Echinicola shivajiensis]|uniref:carbon-nitrogen hydrolase family protein n=1 Tax=Echinicola shivajiensis TaxID=1035916 RepID=UPI001BFC67C1|nr:carbon-nitrogen hydrolase family protein [Echinicola shivajiensis]